MSSLLVLAPTSPKFVSSAVPHKLTSRNLTITNSQTNALLALTSAPILLPKTVSLFIFRIFALFAQPAMSLSTSYGNTAANFMLTPRPTSASRFLWRTNHLRLARFPALLLPQPQTLWPPPPLPHLTPNQACMICPLLAYLLHNFFNLPYLPQIYNLQQSPHPLPCPRRHLCRLHRPPPRLLHHRRPLSFLPRR